MSKSFLIPPIGARALGLDYLQKSGDERCDSPNVTLHPLNELPIKSGGQRRPAVHRGSDFVAATALVTLITQSDHLEQWGVDQAAAVATEEYFGRRFLYFSGMFCRNISAMRGQDRRPDRLEQRMDQISCTW